MFIELPTPASTAVELRLPVDPVFDADEPSTITVRLDQPGRGSAVHASGSRPRIAATTRVARTDLAGDTYTQASSAF